MSKNFTKVTNSTDYCMRYCLFLCVSVFLFASCSNEVPTVEIDFFENDTIPLSEKLEKVLETDYLMDLGFNEEQCLWLQEYYASNQHKTNWINDSTMTENGIQIKGSIERSMWFGIPTKRLNLVGNKKRIWVEEEVILTAQTALMLNDLNNGFLNFEQKIYNPENFVSIEFLDSTLAQRDSLDYDRIFLKQGVPDSNYRFLNSKLYEFCSNYPLDEKTYDIKPVRLDSIHTIIKTKKALVSKGYLSTNEENDSLKFIDALKKFQLHNGLKQDGVVGKYTSWALNESTLSKVLRTALTLEKLRKMKEYPDKCIRINIPEYKLRLYVHDSLKRVHNIIVGKPENQTPELQSKVRNIVVYPYWNVPHSIASKEILPAVKNNRAYLARNNYKIYRRDHEVNPYYVNWKKIKENSFPYKVVQQPGPDNSLGILKFEFHNNYSVYVHDTPSKSLFKSDVRSFSHGCMRCENPIDLGKTILDYDSIRKKRNDITADSLDSLLGLAENYSIRLKSPVPIFVEYNTVYADRDVLIFYLDIYKRDEEYLKIMMD